MLSAIAEVTEPLSEAPNHENSIHETESKSLIAEFKAPIQQANKEEEPFVEETFRLGLLKRQRSFESFGEQNSTTEISEATNYEDESKQIESLVDELIGGISEFEVHDVKKRGEFEVVDRSEDGIENEIESEDIEGERINIEEDQLQEKTKLDTLIEQLTLTDDETDGEQSEIITIKKTISIEDDYQSDTYQPKSREESPNTTNSPLYSAALEQACNRLEYGKESVHRLEEEGFFSYHPKSPEQSPNATADPLYQATLEKVYELDVEEPNSEPILSEEFKSIEDQPLLVNPAISSSIRNDESALINTQFPIVHGGLNYEGHYLICGISLVAKLAIQSDTETRRDSTSQIPLSNEPTCEENKAEDDQEQGCKDVKIVEDRARAEETNDGPKEKGVESPEVTDENKLEEISEKDARELQSDQTPNANSSDVQTPVQSDELNNQEAAKSPALITRTPAPFIKMDRKKEQLVPSGKDDDVFLRQKPLVNEGQLLGEEEETQHKRSSIELPATPSPFSSIITEKPVEQLPQVQIENKPNLSSLIFDPKQPLQIALPSVCLFQKSFHSATSPSLNLLRSSDPWAADFVPQQDSDSKKPTDSKVNFLLSSILLRLQHLEMDDPAKYNNIVDRLHALEAEMSLQNTGLPPDSELTEIVGNILTSDYPHADLQIVVSTSRKTTSSTQFYETETPGMVGLAPEQLRELQSKLINKICEF